MGLKIPNMFGKRYRTIPHELPSGQTAMFKPGAEVTGGKMPGVIGRGLGGRVTNKPPFKAQGYGSGDPRAKVMGKARSEELSQKAAVAGVRQQFKMDEASKAGQITDRELVRQNRIIMRRRKRAV
jgi:hypothetical protein